MRVVADFATPEEFLAAHEQQIEKGGLFVPAVPQATAMAPCKLVVRIGGEEVAEADAQLASANTVIFAGKAAPLDALAARLRGPAKKDVVPLAEKIQLAGSADRELRFALLRDPNKQLHVLVLRNPRISLEEVAFAAKLTTLNPEALKVIAEHPEWGNNPGVVASLVRNPKTPIPIAVRLVPRLPTAELRALAKSQGRPQIVQAAKKKLMNE